LLHWPPRASAPHRRRAPNRPDAGLFRRAAACRVAHRLAGAKAGRAAVARNRGGLSLHARGKARAHCARESADRKIAAQASYLCGLTRSHVHNSGFEGWHLFTRRAGCCGTPQGGLLTVAGKTRPESWRNPVDKTERIRRREIRRRKNICATRCAQNAKAGDACASTGLGETEEGIRGRSRRAAAYRSTRQPHRSGAVRCRTARNCATRDASRRHPESIQD
jgi:hypothetical protein